MAKPRHPKPDRGPSEKLAALATEAVAAFRADSPKAFKELLSAFGGKSADLALFGHGRIHVSVSKSGIDVQADKLRSTAATGLGATDPRTLLAILEGRLTPLEAFFKGDLIARADSAVLHEAYEHFMRFCDAALRSKKMRGVTAKLCESFGGKQRA